jgi:Ubiquitin carboxyl-terminal hydrolase
MRTTRSHTNKASDDASRGTGTPANEAMKKTSKAPPKPKSTSSKKVTAGEKATSRRKVVDGNQTANGNDKPENDSSELSPLPSPANSVGDLIAHRNSDSNVLTLVRQGMQNRTFDVVPFGVTNPGWMCYCNSVITMLLNITPFAGYVNQLHGSNVMAGLTDPDSGAYIENPERDLLSRLNDVAVAYWSDDSAGVSSKQARIDQLVTAFWNYTIDLNASFDAAPWDPGQGKERNTFQDAADYLLTVLNLAIAQLSANPNIW